MEIFILQLQNLKVLISRFSIERGKGTGRISMRQGGMRSSLVHKHFEISATETFGIRCCQGLCDNMLAQDIALCFTCI